jgi:hypothetical protein
VTVPAGRGMTEYDQRFVVCVCLCVCICDCVSMRACVRVAEKLLLIPTFNLRWLLFDSDFIPFHYYFSDMIYLCERERRDCGRRS